MKSGLLKLRRNGSKITMKRASSHRQPDQASSKLLDTADYNSSPFVGTAQFSGSKDQDLYSVEKICDPDGSFEHRDFGYFSVIDGHGAVNTAAEITVADLSDEIFKLHVASMSDSGNSDSDDDSVLPTDEIIQQAFKNIHEKTVVALKEQKQHRSGACVTSVLLSETKGKIAWLGDCRCIVLDDSNEVVIRTEDHCVETNPKERMRIEEQIKCTVPRESLLNAPKWKEEVSKAEKEGRKLRAQSFIGRRQLSTGIEVGDKVIFSYTNGISLQVSRSIGDPMAARSAIHVPEIVEFDIASTATTNSEMLEGTKFFLGSDGFWDVFTEKEITTACKQIDWTSADLPALSATMVAKAKKRRKSKNLNSDDITLMIIHVPSVKISVTCSN